MDRVSGRSGGSRSDRGIGLLYNHYVTDIHATILKLLGLDSRRLEIPGRKRLDVDHGRSIDRILA